MHDDYVEEYPQSGERIRGKIKSATGYFAEPFEAPEWLAQWVERP